MSEEVAEYIEEPQEQETEQVEEQQEPEPEKPKEETEQEKYSKRVQKRIDKLEWEKNEEKRRAYALEQELEQLRNGKQEPKQSSTGQPNADDFPAGRYDPDYLVALTEYKIQQSIDNLQKSATVSEQRKLIELQQEQARQTHADYDDVTAELLDHPLANDPGFNEAILSADNVASVAYYLGTHPEELDNLAAIRNNPAKMLKAIGRIEALLETPKPLEPKKIPVSNAPKPVSPVGNAKQSSTIKSPETMTMDEYAKWRKSQSK